MFLVQYNFFLNVKIEDIFLIYLKICSFYFKKETTYIYNGERKQGKRAYRLYIKTRENIPHINYTSRKKLTTHKTHGYAHRHIVKIEHTGRYEDMTCIKVDSKDSLFITEH